MRKRKKQICEIIEVLAEDDICNVLKTCGNTFINCCILFSVILSTVVFGISVVFNKILAVLGLNSISLGCQLPQEGKLFGTGNISLCSPILKISDIPTSAWNSM